MTDSLKKKALGTLALVAVAGLSYAAGAAKGKTPVNIPTGDIKWEAYAPGVPLQVAKLWGDRAKGGDYAMLLKMPAGFEAGMHSHTADYHAVSVQGTWVHTNEGDPASGKDMAPGSYVMQPGKQVHNDMCKSGSECIVFVHQHAKGDFIPAKAKEAAAPASAPAPAGGGAATHAKAPGTAPVAPAAPAPAPAAKAPAAMPAAPAAPAPAKK